MIASNFPSFSNDEIEDWVKSEEISYDRFDFLEALGDTVRERTESLYLKLYELSQKIVDNGGVGYCWILTNKVISDLITGMLSSWQEINQIPLGASNPHTFTSQNKDQVTEVGVVLGKYRIFMKDSMENYVAIGIGDDPKHIAFLEIFDIDILYP